MSPRIPFEDVVPLWVNGYYDGPLTGVCLVHEKPHYYECVLDSDWGHRHYRLRSLTDEQFDRLTKGQELFAKYVGTHTYLSPDWHRDLNGVHKQENWHDFYDLSPEDKFITDLSGQPVVGWFSRTPHLKRPRSYRYWLRQGQTPS